MPKQPGLRRVLFFEGSQNGPEARFVGAIVYLCNTLYGSMKPARQEVVTDESEKNAAPQVSWAG